MNKATKILTSSIIALSFAGLAYAVDNSADTTTSTSPSAVTSPATNSGFQQFHQRGHWQDRQGRFGMHGMHGKRGNFAMSWNHALHKLHPLTTTEAKTVAEAAVILYGDNTMKVGTVTPVQGKFGKQNYEVQITNQQGQTIGTVVMNGINGRAMKIKH